MTLRKEDITQIAKQVAPEVRELLANDPAFAVPKPSPEIWERILTFERELTSQGQELRTMNQELKAQRELMETRFDAMDKRFADSQKHLDQRFADTQKTLDQRFADAQRQADLRFEAVEKRFEAMDKRFDDMRHASDRHFTVLTWFMGLGVTILAFMMTLYRFLA
jgi:hypothetical protein